MEDTLRVRGYVSQDDGTFVLILVLMEDTLRATIDVGVTHSIMMNPLNTLLVVLILVLMEDTLRVARRVKMVGNVKS